MKLSTLNNIFTKDKKSHYLLLSKLLSHNVKNVYVNTDFIKSEIDGIGVYFVSGNVDNVEDELVKKTLIDIQKKCRYGKSFSKQSFARALPIKSNKLFVYIKEKNAIVFALDFFCRQFMPSNNQEGRIEYINYIFDNYMSEPLKSVKIIKDENFNEKDIAEYLLSSIQKNFDTLGNDKEELENQLRHYSNEITNITRKLEFLINTKKRLNNINNKGFDYLHEEIKDVLKLPFIKSMVYNNRQNCLEIDVGEIRIKKTYIGDFIIYIEPNYISFENKTNKRQGYHHPHVMDDCSPCFGTRHAKVFELLGRYQLKPLIFFLYQFLKTYNEDSCYMEIRYWQKKIYGHHDDD